MMNVKQCAFNTYNYSFVTPASLKRVLLRHQIKAQFTSGLNLTFDSAFFAEHFFS